MRLTSGRMNTNGMPTGHTHDDRYTPAITVPIRKSITLVPGQAYLVVAEVWVASADMIDLGLFRGEMVVFVKSAEESAVISPGEIWTPFTNTTAAEAWLPTAIPVVGGLRLETSAPEEATVEARLFYRAVGSLS